MGNNREKMRDFMGDFRAGVDNRLRLEIKTPLISKIWHGIAVSREQRLYLYGMKHEVASNLIGFRKWRRTLQ